MRDSQQRDPPFLDFPTSRNFELSDHEPLNGSGSGSDSDSSDPNADEPLSDSILDEDAPVDRCEDIPGISPGQGKDIVITQPAIDDVDGDFFFPCDENSDEDHLSSHTFGHVYASSGIRRWKRNDVLHEIDWSLIQVDPARLQFYNTVLGGRRFHPESEPQDPSPPEEPVSRHYYTQEEKEYPMEVAPADSLGGLNVYCFGRITGLQGGLVGPSMGFVKRYHRKTFSKSWDVAGGFGVGGDAGAWVIENITGRVCGIVLSWNERNRVAYIMPMQIVLKDIKRTLGARDVCLPRFKAGQET